MGGISTDAKPATDDTMPPRKIKLATGSRASKRKRPVNGVEAAEDALGSPAPPDHHDEDSPPPGPQPETLVSPSTSGAGVGPLDVSTVQALVGYCFCKDWKVTINEPISGVVVCHCKDCQAISASFFCTFLTVKSRSLLMVEPRDREARNTLKSTFYYTIKTGDNTGRKQSRTFCSRCGTVLFATPESLEGALPVNRNLFVGDHNDNNPLVQEILSPKIEIFTKDRESWRPGAESVLHEYVSMPIGMGGGDAPPQPPGAGDIHL